MLFTVFLIGLKTRTMLKRCLSGKDLEFTFSRWWFQIFLIFAPILGEMIKFDEYIFQMGWFNHQ